ncbi:Uncharacterized protein GBIM_15188 [Gryllus bimaculatus]|nr:Uncharacterized protein GBIM_15188 [Gryllus bimaculatus]
MDEYVLTLFPLLHSTYQAINLTYQVLDVNCYEQQNVLKRWILPVKEESYECTCTPDFEEPEDMVNDIQCAVERAKTTRKIMKVNDKRYNRSEVTNSPLESLKTNHFKDAQKGKVNDSINKNSEKCSIKSVGNKISAERDIHTHHVKQREPKLRTNIKINKAHTFQTTYQKDFSVRNSHKTSQTIANKMKHPVKQCATTVDIKVENAENVDSLLEKVSTGFCKTSDVKMNSFQNVKGDNCILHGEISQRVVHRCVNLNEAMNSLGAPPELVKLLRTFHQYVNVADKLQLKRKCSKQSFLQKLNESNQYWHRAEPEPVMKLCLRYLLAFVNIIPKKKFEWSGINLKEMEEEFNLLSQSYNKRLDFNESLSENVFRVRKESELIVFENTAKKIHWALTGVWNRKCWSMFSGLKDMLKISYASKEDCLALHQKIQDIQKLQLQVEILIFLKNSFPFLSDLQNDHIALAHLYKSYSALCNISSVMVPVLLKN